MFSDQAKIHVTAGRGGHGCTSFRREKHVPRGGPDGGDGGPGGSVYLVGDPQMRDLSPFVRRVHFKSEVGTHGEGSRRDGAAGADLEIPVPLGTVIRHDGEVDLGCDPAGAEGARGQGRTRRSRQRPLRQRHPPGAALRRAGRRG